MSPHIIIMFCSVLWYFCVLILWMWLGRSMSLFGNHSLFGWFMIAAAFIFSLAANFLINPLAWAIAALSIQTAKKEGVQSVWRFYPAAIGIIFTIAMVAAVFVNIARTQKAGTWKGPVPLTTQGAERVETSDGLKINGIMYSSDPSALVNDQVVKKGDTLGGYEVIEVREHSVVFADQDGNLIEKR